MVCLAAVVASCTASGPAGAGGGKTIHVALGGGDDANAGSADAPLASIARALKIVRPGDTILLAPGLYRLQSQDNYGIRILRDGTEEAPITMRGNGGEAILDCSALTRTPTVYCLQLEADWWRISNIAVTGATQNGPRNWAVGINLLNASNNILRSVRAFRNQGPGIALVGRSANNMVADCESFANYDPKAAIPGDHADGIQITSIDKNQTGNVISRCYSHNNSDDGFDLWKAEAPVTIQNSVATRNGWVPGTFKPAGDGVGFKLGKNSSDARHRIMHNRAFDNRAAGFDRNGAAQEPIYVNNTARGNGGGSYR